MARLREEGVQALNLGSEDSSSRRQATQASLLGAPLVPGFEISELLGEGATGRVWRARQVAMDREVALKVIFTEGDRGARRALRLFREARLSGALDHPGIVRGIAAGEVPEFSWFAMELVHGRTLEDIIAARGGLPSTAVLRIGRELSAALAHAHDHGVVHRDVKPSNVMIDERSGQARLLDLGLARHEDDPRLTRESGTLGTPQYMAPEQARDPSAAGAHADIFSLGATLYTGVAGSPPFAGRNVAEVLTALLYDEPQPLAEAEVDAPPGLDDLLARAMAKNPQDRPSSMGEFGRELEAIARGTPTRSRRGKSKQGAARRRQIMAASLGGLVLLIGVTIALSAWFNPGKTVSHQDPGSAPTAYGKPAPGDPGPESVGTAGHGEGHPSGLTWDARAQPFLARDATLHGAAMLDLLNEARQDPHASRTLAKELQSRWELGLNAMEARVRGTVRGHLHKFGDKEAARGRLAAEWQSGIDQMVGEAAKRPEWVQTALNKRRAGLDSGLETMITALAQRQLDHALETLRAVRLRLGRQRLDRSAIEREVRSAVAAADLSALGEDQFATFQRERTQLIEFLTLGPFKRWERLRQRIESCLNEEHLQLVDASALVLEARETQSELDANARREIEAFARRITTLRTRTLEAANALFAPVARRNGQAIGPEDLRARAQRLRQGIESLAPDPKQIEGLAELAQRAEHLAELLERAADLRAEVATALLAAEDQPRAVHLGSRGGAARPRRWLKTEKRRRNPRLHFESESGTRSYPFDDLPAPALMALMQALDAQPKPEHFVVLAHAEADDTLAWRMYFALEEEARNPDLQALVEAGLAARRRSFDRESEREGFDRLVVALRAEQGRRLDEAAKIYEELARRIPRELRGAWWRQHKDWIEDRHESLQRGLRDVARWARFSAFEAESPSSSARHYRLDLRESRVRGLLDLSDGSAKWTQDGVLLQTPAASVRGGPERAPAVRLPIPDIEDGRLTLRLEARWPKGATPIFFSLRLAGTNYLHLEQLADHLVHRSRELHGFERGLNAMTPIRRFGAWEGEISDWRSHWPNEFSGRDSLVEEAQRLTFVIEWNASDGRVSWGNRPEPLACSARLAEGAMPQLEVRAATELLLTRIDLEWQTH